MLNLRDLIYSQSNQDTALSAGAEIGDIDAVNVTQKSDEVQPRIHVHWEDQSENRRRGSRFVSKTTKVGRSRGKSLHKRAQKFYSGVPLRRNVTMLPNVYKSSPAVRMIRTSELVPNAKTLHMPSQVDLIMPQEDETDYREQARTLQSLFHESFHARDYPAAALVSNPRFCVHNFLCVFIASLDPTNTIRLISPRCSDI
jgi:hypothetical protein